MRGRVDWIVFLVVRTKRPVNVMLVTSLVKSKLGLLVTNVNGLVSIRQANPHDKEMHPPSDFPI